jgi:hypothetical protein
MLTVDEARALVAEIRRHAAEGDDEAAHSVEDDLRERALGAIYAGAPNAVELAGVALSTKRLGFDRWCA